MTFPPLFTERSWTVSLIIFLLLKQKRTSKPDKTSFILEIKFCIPILKSIVPFSIDFSKILGINKSSSPEKRAKRASIQ